MAKKEKGMKIKFVDVCSNRAQEAIEKLFDNLYLGDGMDFDLMPTKRAIRKAQESFSDVLKKAHENIKAKYPNHKLKDDKKKPENAKLRAMALAAIGGELQIESNERIQDETTIDIEEKFEIPIKKINAVMKEEKEKGKEATFLTATDYEILEKFVSFTK